MNYLAHIYLSGHDEEMMLGNFYGDFERKAKYDNYSLQIRRGLILHHAIDRYSDLHQSSKTFYSLLRPTMGKYGRVAVDIIWDYFLSQTWHLRSKVTLRYFCDHFYDILKDESYPKPDKLKPKIQAMVESDFLMSTASISRLVGTMTFMNKRVDFKTDFLSSIPVLIENEETLMNLFDILMNDLIIYYQRELRKSMSR